MNLGAGTATLRVTNQSVRDFGSIPNAINNGASSPSAVSYSIHWYGVKARRQVHNADLHVAGQFTNTHASIWWTGHNQSTGFTFTSDPTGQTVVSAQLGHERNGRFFS